MKNKKGFTLLESLMSMLIVAIIAGGVFATLMSARRAISQPTYREDMLFALESAKDMFQNFAVNNVADNSTSWLVKDIAEERFCGNSISTLISGNDVNINCLLPETCGIDNSSFTLRVLRKYDSSHNPPTNSPYEVFFRIVCNGETL